MRSRDYDLTDEQHTIVHDTLPKIADLALAYLISGLPKDSYFDGWAGMMIAAGDTSSWGDEAMGCALVDVGEKYEKFARAIRMKGDNTSVHTSVLAAEARGALLRAGSLLVLVTNKLVQETDVPQMIAVALEKYLEAKQKIVELGIPIED